MVWQNTFAGSTNRNRTRDSRNQRSHQRSFSVGNFHSPGKLADAGANFLTTVPTSPPLYLCFYAESEWKWLPRCSSPCSWAPQGVGSHHPPPVSVICAQGQDQGMKTSSKKTQERINPSCRRHSMFSRQSSTTCTLRVCAPMQMQLTRTLLKASWLQLGGCIKLHALA